MAIERKEYRIYNAIGEFTGIESESGIATLAYQRIFFPNGKVIPCNVTDIEIVSTMRIVNVIEIVEFLTR